MTVQYAKAPAGIVGLTINKKLAQGVSSYLLNEKLPLDAARKRFERVNSLARLPDGVMVYQAEYGGVPVEIVDPEHQSHAKTILYCHGGGFCIGSPRTHRELTAWLAKTLRARVVVPDYRLAPEHPYPGASDDMIAVYKALVSSGVLPENLAIAGDSAGGNLALVTLLRLKELEEALPAATVLYSPWVDLRCMSESYMTKKATDPLLTGGWLRRMRERYSNGIELTDPHLSPVFGDLSGLPPVLIHTGSEEVLLNDSLLLVRHLKEQGNEAHLKTDTIL